MGAKGGTEDLDPALIQFVASLFSPLMGQVGAGSIDGLGDIEQVALAWKLSTCTAPGKWSARFQIQGLRQDSAWLKAPLGRMTRQREHGLEAAESRSRTGMPLGSSLSGELASRVLAEPSGCFGGLRVRKDRQARQGRDEGRASKGSGSMTRNLAPERFALRSTCLGSTSSPASSCSRLGVSKADPRRRHPGHA